MLPGFMTCMRNYIIIDWHLRCLPLYRQDAYVYYSPEKYKVQSYSRQTLQGLLQAAALLRYTTLDRLYKDYCRQLRCYVTGAGLTRSHHMTNSFSDLDPLKRGVPRVPTG